MARLLAAAILLLAGAHLVAGEPAPPPRAVTNPLVGVWGTEGAILVIEERSLRFLLSDPDKPTLTADYSVTKDGIVFGIITRERLSSELELPKGSFLDETFRFRVSVDGKEMTVKNVRLPVPRLALDPHLAKAWAVVNKVEGGQDPRAMCELGMLRLEGALTGAYERTSLTKANRCTTPPTYAPSPYTESPSQPVVPPPLPSKGSR